MDTAERVPAVDLRLMPKNPPFSGVAKHVSIKGQHGKVIFLDPRRIRLLPNNPRGRSNEGFSPESLRGLAQGIKAVGQEMPVKVCVSTMSEYDAQLIDGERRTLACKLGEMLVACLVDETLDDTNMELLYVKAVVSNFQREGHNCIEKAEACQNMLALGMTAEEIGKSVGYSQFWVAQHLSLLRLSPSVQSLLITPPEVEKKKGELGRKKTSMLSFQIGIMLVNLPAEIQEKAVERVISENMSDLEARRMIRNIKRDKEVSSSLKVKQRARPGRMFDSLRSLVGRSTQAFGIYLDMHPQEIATMVASQDIVDREELSKQIHLLTGCLNDIAERVKGKKPKR
ncbi:MAG: ParB family transcriptional regulator, chromosome partitioning protein [Patescibacteria group bacterium]|nr:ParB family transcriptional regulator, chromosome partitioning protein [Patescibacteria group bacterium]